ncbi:MAG TPA: PQQ-binding-like beta-propeller repeat protein [Candidatus Cybelea sp.]|nr:PQQ-binding-like beta-propeller repeat protein [Candidatus Cybelea sp.]
MLKILCALCVVFAASGARSADWYRYRGPDLNGISTETGWQTHWPAEGPKRLWKASIGTGFSSVTVSHGRLYAFGNTGNSDTVYCFDAATGATVWKHTYPCPLDPHFYEGGTSCTPTVDDDRVYTISRKGDLFCLDAAKGSVIWSLNVATDLGDEIPTWGLAGSPLVQGDMLILNVGSAGTALDKMTGKVRWASPKGSGGYATPVPFDFHGEHCLAIMSLHTLEAVRLANGKSLWRYPWKTDYDVNAADPIIVGDDKIFISSGYGHGSTLLDISKGKPVALWENPDFRNHIATSILWNGFLYGTDDVNKSTYELKCVDLKTGAIKWSEPSFGKGTLTMADGKFIGLSDKGMLMVIEPSPEGFKAISSAQVLGGKCWTAPVLSNGRIYCRNSRGDLVCLDVSGKP